VTDVIVHLDSSIGAKYWRSIEFDSGTIPIRPISRVLSSISELARISISIGRPTQFLRTDF
jgi:hypothetical protein